MTPNLQFFWLIQFGVKRVFLAKMLHSSHHILGKMEQKVFNLNNVKYFNTHTALS